MTPKLLPDEDAKALLTRALQDPFGFEPVSDWFDLLMRDFPLWSFQVWAYANIRQSKLPINYPLQLIIRSISADEGLSPGERQFLEPLPNALDKRRDYLADIGRFGRTVEVIERRSVYPTYEELPLRRGPSLFNRFYPLPQPPDEIDPEDPTSYGPVYEKIGRELVRLVDARNATLPGTEERDQASENLEEFLKSIGVRLRPGRQTEGPSDEMCTALVTEGVKLLELCWHMFPVSVSDDSRQILAAADVTDSQEQELWAARLALPVLSLPEILGLEAQSKKERAWTWVRGGGYPTPKQVTIWILAPRLRMNPRTLARKTLSARTAYYHPFDGPNPIDAFRK